MKQKNVLGAKIYEVVEKKKKRIRFFRCESCGKKIYIKEDGSHSRHRCLVRKL